ncbi:MAG TPA: DUF2330 domain-containing protein [Gemmataceae bacterium]|nr:DUF2330 domain-containing protein [Gemmataceae bacterium]
MNARTWFTLALAGICLLPILPAAPAPGCCPAPPPGKPVVNADQTVILIWDAATKTQHFIRKASFQSEADDFGFLVPTPNEPALEESGNDAFPYLQKLTEPEIVKTTRPSDGISCGCATKFAAKGDLQHAPPPVKVLAEKEVAGFKAVVLETRSAAALVAWLKKNGYAFSPEVEAWAKPYVEQGWKITALQVAKDQDGKAKKSLTTAALRLTFQTEQPLFPYREPDSRAAAEALGARNRLLRIYFIADARYNGELTKETPWTGKVAWANKLSPESRKQALELLKLPQTTGPAEWWLTEFEDNWPYRVAPADVTFARDPSQNTVKRPPIIQYVASPWPTDVMGYALIALLAVPPVYRRFRQRPTA